MEKHLVLDDHSIEARVRLKRCFHQPRKHGPPVLEPERPAEKGRIYLWSTPCYDPRTERWLMWYCDHDKRPLLAQSRDGLAWERPSLPHNRDRKERWPDEFDLGFDAPERYRKERRIAAVREPRSGRYHALCLHCRGPSRGLLKPLLSEDGVRWSVAPGAGPSSGDEYRLACDATRRRFLATVKQDKNRVRGRYGVAEFSRAVALSVSADFEHWSEPELTFHADAEDQEQGAIRIEEAFDDPRRRQPAVRAPEEYRTDVYAMPLLPDASCTLGWPVLFHQSGSNSHLQADLQNQEGLLVPELAWTYDLRTWHRPRDRQPFIPLSTTEDPQCYDQGIILITAPVRRDGEYWFYYSGQRYGHASTLGEVYRSTVAAQAPAEGLPMGGIFLARMREDGMASLRAGGEGGWFLSRVLTVRKPRLWINAAAAGGEIRAQIRDALTGQAIPGYTFGPRARFLRTVKPEPRDESPDTSIPFTGDETRAMVAWRERADLAPLLGREIRIDFHLRNADLFAFGFE